MPGTDKRLKIIKKGDPVTLRDVMHHGPMDGAIFTNNGVQVHEYYCGSCTYPVNRDDERCENCGAGKPFLYHWEFDPKLMIEVLQGVHQPQPNMNLDRHKPIKGNK